MWSTQTRPKSGQFLGIKLLLPLIIVAPKALKKSLSPRISLLRFSSLRVHCLITVTWLPYVQFALKSCDQSASKQKYIKQNYRNYLCLAYEIVRTEFMDLFAVPGDHDCETIEFGKNIFDRSFDNSILSHLKERNNLKNFRFEIGIKMNPTPIYYYDPHVGSFHYGPMHPMKPHRNDQE